MTTLRVTMIDNKPAVFLPPELAERLNVSAGGEVQAIDAPSGTFLQKYDPETSAQLDIALDVMNRRRDALRRLAE